MRHLIGALATRPSVLLLLGLGMYTLNYVLGPFSYKIYNVDGIIYFGLNFLCLWLGVFLLESKRSRPLPIEFVLSRRAELVLIVMMIGVIAANIVSLYYLFYVSGVSYAEGLSGARHVLASQADFGINKPTWSKVARLIVSGGSAFYLVVAGLSRLNYSITGILGIVCALGTAGYILIQGGRNAALYVMLLIVFVSVLRVHRGMSPLPDIPGLKYIVIVACVGIIGLSIYIFQERSQSIYASQIAIESRYLLSTGDMELKRSYAALNQQFGGSLTPFYMLSYYLSHSLPFFSWLFDTSKYSEVFFGAYHLRMIGFIVTPLGIPYPSQLEIIQTQPFYGLYTSFVQDALLDWGILLAPLFSLSLGCLIGYLHRLGFAGTFWALAYLPAIFVICSIITIYGVNWGDGDFVAFMYIFLVIVFRVQDKRQPTTSPTVSRLSGYATPAR